MGAWIGGVWNGHFPESEKSYSPFASSYLPIACFFRIDNRYRYRFHFFELIKVTVTDGGPVGVLPSPSSNCQEVTDSKFLGINFGKSPILLPFFLIILNSFGKY